jgi:NADPH2:quinone reductase
VDVGVPAANQVRLRQRAIGVNFHDVYVRTGLYKTLRLPGIPGVEAVGIVEAVGDDVRGVKAGDRVGYITNEYGAYAETRLFDADWLIRLPASIDDRTAAASLTKGLTAWMLLAKVRQLKQGETCLIQAAAGGVGQILTQWAAHLGARVIGTAGSAEKANIARDCGCEEVILYRQENVPARVRELTGGRGVDVAYDSVGRDTFSGSLDSLASRGHLINFGQSSGAIEPFAVSRLMEKSNTLSRPILFHYIVDRAERQELADRFFEALGAGVIRIRIAGEHALRDAAAAHRALESRATAGSTILLP